MSLHRKQSHIRAILVFVIGVVLASGATVSTQGRNRPRVIFNGYEAVQGEVLVKFRAAAPGQFEGLQQQLDADQSEEIGHNLGIHRIHSRTFSLDALVAFLRTHPAIAFVEPNYVLRTTAIPTDPQFGNLWGLLNTGQSVNGAPAGAPGADIHATSAWDVSTGSAANVVAVIDTGIDYNHGDLAPNVWAAPAAFTVTIGGRTITCDAGTHGFNAITNTCDPLDDNDHGSHVSGTIGAAANNGVGVAGVNWTASIMASKFLDASGSGTLANAINAIEFTIQAKAALGAAANVRVLNNSWGGGGFSQALLDEINKTNANDMLFVAAAGNNGLNNDVWAAYPADYTYWGATNIVAVAATDNNDQLASFSNYGPTLVHLGAPGVNILSTTRGNTYQYFNGTSMATPHVSGAAALVLSKCTLNTAALKNNLLNNVDTVAGLNGWVSTNGRLNVDKAIRACTPTAPSAPTNLAATGGDAQVSLTWSPSASATSYNVKRGTATGTETFLTSVATTSYLDTGLTNGQTYFYVVSAVNAVGESGDSSEASATPNPPPPVPAAPTDLTATAGVRQVSLSWSASSGATSYTVKRGATSGAYSVIATGVTATSYTDSSVTGWTTYYYVVVAVNSSGPSTNSNEVSATPFGIPSAPTNLQATSGPNTGQISLTWFASTGATSYNVKRRGSNSGPYTTIKTGVTATAYVDSGRASGKRYDYVVSAVNSAGQSSNSNQASAVAK